jgi:hypothetical protein
MVILSLYLLFMSRSEEVHTVWEVLHPAFIPVFFIATFLLLTIVFSSERFEYKLILIIVHSILCHSFFVIIFPAGKVGPQQIILGQTRLVFDNVIFHGLGWARKDLPLQIYVTLRGENLQTAFSVILARMFGVDVYWTHLLLVPLLWGIFVPLIAFMVSKTLGASDKISALSSLVVSLFPANILWGAESIPNGLSYLFFFVLTYFLLKYIKSNGQKDLLIVATFFFASFLSHYLAGIIAFSLLILTYSIKTYEKEKWDSPVSARILLLMAFLFCASVMPNALAFRRFFYPRANTYFSLQKLYESSPTGMVLSLLFGSYFDLISREAYGTTLIFWIPTLLGLIGLTYILIANVKKSPKGSINPSMLFLFLAFLMVIVDDRIVKLFMINVPFIEFERLWLFRDFMLVSFTALVIGAALQKMRAIFNILSQNAIQFLRKKFSLRIFSRTFSFFAHGRLVSGVSLGSSLAYLVLFTIISGWITASVYYAYPHWGPLQTTSYEIEAAKYIKQNTTQRYIVICDIWMTLAGRMFIGMNNPQVFYFTSTDPRGVTLFMKMKNNPSNETMIEAMKINNATIAYFIIEKPRLGPETYNRIIAQAQQNSLQTYQVFYLKGEEKLRIFHYRKTSPTEQ